MLEAAVRGVHPMRPVPLPEPLDYNAAVRRQLDGAAPVVSYASLGRSVAGVLGAAAEMPALLAAEAHVRTAAPAAWPATASLAAVASLAGAPSVVVAAAGRAADAPSERWWVPAAGDAIAFDDVPQFAPAVAFPLPSRPLGHVAADGRHLDRRRRVARARRAAPTRRLRRPTLPTITRMC